MIIHKELKFCCFEVNKISKIRSVGEAIKAVEVKSREVIRKVTRQVNRNSCQQYNDIQLTLTCPIFFDQLLFSQHFYKQFLKS